LAAVGDVDNIENNFDILLSTLMPTFRLENKQALRYSLLAAVVVAAGLICLYARNELERRTATINRLAITMERDLQKPSGIGAAEGGAPQLGKIDELDNIASDLHALAVENGLMLIDANYQMASDEAASHLGRVEISLRLKGGYIPARKVIAAMLSSHAGLALDSVSVQRQRSIDSALEIDLRFTLFYKKSVMPA
jgi:hypothetical protein